MFSCDGRNRNDVMVQYEDRMEGKVKDGGDGAWISVRERIMWEERHKDSGGGDGS